MVNQKEKNVNVSIGVRGIIKSIILKDTRTGQIVEKRENIKNTLLNDYLNSIFTKDDAQIIPHHDGSRAAGQYCFIGTDNTPPERNQNAILNEIGEGEKIEMLGSPRGERQIYVEEKYHFPAGEGTGTIEEIGIARYSPSGGQIARQIIEPLVKESYHELEVVWRRELIVPDYWESTIESGGRQGEDITCRIYINNEQLWRICQSRVTGSSDSTNNCFYPLFITSTGYLHVLVGDDNSASDLNSTDRFNRKGSDIFTAYASLHSKESYVANSYTRQAIFGFEDGDANGDIGEIVLVSSPYSYNPNQTGFARLTFDPPLNKVDKFRLYIYFSVTIDPEVD